MPMSPPLKRQRTVPSALTAPFKSPVPRKGQDRSSNEAKSRTPSSAPPRGFTFSHSASFLSSQAASDEGTQTSPHQDPLRRPQLSSGETTTTTPTTSRTSSRPSPLRPTNIVDPELRMLQREVTSLTAELSHLRDGVDVATQAIRLELHAERDADLERLIGVWRAAARSAAEDVLHSATDRINALGGLQAFRTLEAERLERRKEAFGEMDQMHARSNERDEYEDVGVDESERTAKQEEDPTPWMRGDEETLTMDLLLKSLNIEPGALGYDTVE